MLFRSQQDDPLPCPFFRRGSSCWSCRASPPGGGDEVEGYIRNLPEEPPAARAARHAWVAERRAGSVIIAHRGASTLAPENTIESYVAAMDYGADGCEVDPRRTRDGVWVLFHDDMLDRLTDGFGRVEEIPYAELLQLRASRVQGTSLAGSRPPTLAALLHLARQRAMLFHLDVKEPGHEEEIALLKSPNPAVRGAALLECLDQPGRDRESALREAAPWASGLPRRVTVAPGEGARAPHAHRR